MLRPMLRPMVLNPLRRIGKPAWGSFSPRSLFAAGEQGVWYDPSDLSTLFQDAGATTPVTAHGQPVALIRDKSGRGNHATLSNVTLDITAGRYSLVSNGSTSSGLTGAINFSATDKMTVWAGVRKLSDAATGILTELTAGTPTNSGAFCVGAPSLTGTNKFSFTSKGTNEQSALTTDVAYNAPYTAVVTATGDISGDRVFLRVNGVQVGSNVGDQGTGNFSTAILYLFGRGGTTLRFNGNLYGLIVRGAATDAASIAKTERWMSSKTGVVL